MFFIKYGAARVHEGWQARHFRGCVNGKEISGEWWFVGSQWTTEQPTMPAPPPLEPKYITFIATCIADLKDRDAEGYRVAAGAFAHAMAVTNGKPEQGAHQFGRLRFTLPPKEDRPCNVATSNLSQLLPAHVFGGQKGTDGSVSRSADS